MGKSLAQITAEVCARLGIEYPPKPLHVDLPDVPDDAGPVEIMLAEAAAHRQFMASVASPAPRLLALGSTFEDGSRRPMPEPTPEPELEQRKPRPLSEIIRDVQAKQAAREILPRRQPDTGRGRDYGR